MQKFLTLVMILGASVLVSGCVAHHHGAIDDYVVGEEKSPHRQFNKSLSKFYKKYFNTYRMSISQSLKAMGHMRSKKNAARSHMLVLPEALEDYNLAYAHVAEFTKARLRLMHLLNKSARSKHPKLAAETQVAFDCWIEQQSKVYAGPVKYKGSCKQKFYENLMALEAHMRPPEYEYTPMTYRPIEMAPPPTLETAPRSMGMEEIDEEMLVEDTDYTPEPAPRRVREPMPQSQLAPQEETQAETQPAIAPENLEFTVYFDFDKSDIRPDAGRALKQASALAKSFDAPVKLNISGHTDTMGTSQYNKKLAEKRVKSVLNYLVDQGLEPIDIQAFAAGESQLAVPTPDQTREPLNRRVETIMVIE